MAAYPLPEPDTVRQNGALEALSLIRLAETVLDTAFQPIVDAATGSLAAWESLMRGHDKAGCATPPDFIDLAHATGVLLGLEKLMVRKAVRKFAAQPNRSGLMLFLNLDSRLIGEGEKLVPRLLMHLAEAGIVPSMLCFELSERFDVTEDPGFRPLMDRMRRAGFRFAIDDFGAGVGEMKLLCDYPVDYVKIDRHFISAIEASPRKRQIVGNLVQTAHRLGAKVVAEGVETAAESETCRDLGVDYLQGWFIGRPSIEVSAASRDFPHLRRQSTVEAPANPADRDLIHSRIEFPPSLSEDDGVERAFDIFRANPGQGYLPVLGLDGAPRGILKEERLKEFIYQPFGRDLLKNRTYSRTAAHFADTAPVVALDMATETMLAVFASVDESPCLMLTEGGSYAGVVSAASLLKVMHEKSLQDAQDQNPLTGLPGNRAIGGYLARTAAGIGETRYFCYCDFDHFKPFNDLYGFQKGDHAIMLFSALMRRYFFADSAFLGHVGGDDFFIGLRGVDEGEVLDLVQRLTDDFRDEVAGLYAPEARVAGLVRGRDRAGGERDYPLMRCSIGVLVLPEEIGATSVGDLAAAIATLKTDAKKSPTGICLRLFDPEAN